MSHHSRKALKQFFNLKLSIMKQILFSFFLVASLGLTSKKMNAQACPIIVSSGFTTTNSAACTQNVFVNITNQTAGNKTVFVEVKNGSTVIFSECIIFSGDKDNVQVVSTNSFAFCGNLNQLIIAITPSTSGANCSNSGNCGTQNFDPISNSPLPVKFKSFSAIRNKEKVAVKWVTTTEINNRGFNVQRNTNGVWENIAFVFSAAQDGNSADDLSYSFNDLNKAKKISQYRIQQVDLDNRATYTDVRSVYGIESSSKLLVYPNPSNDGKINLLFENSSSVRNITVNDISGRVVKQYKNVTGESMAIENLGSGMYSIQVIDLSTAIITVEKLIVKKR